MSLDLNDAVSKGTTYRLIMLTRPSDKAVRSVQRAGPLSTVGGMDPVEPAVSLALVHAANDRLLTTARALSDADVAAPSALPDWSRGHLLTHVARNADGLINLFRSARTGEDHPMYPSAEHRAAAIEAGSARPIGVIVDDLAAAHERFIAAAAETSDWSPEVRHRSDARLPVWAVPLLRLGELEIHHTDLDMRYGYDRWPSEWVTAYLPFAATELTDRAGEPIGLRATDTDARVESSEPAARTVEGPQAALLAWVTGRHDGHDLRVTPDGALPTLGSWR